MPTRNDNLFRTIIVFEVLHEGEIPSDMGLDGIVRETIDGSFAGKWHGTSQSVTAEEMARALAAEGHDPSVILGDDWDTNTEAPDGEEDSHE